MKLLLSWVADYVDLKGVNYKKLADKLVHIGFEVEEIIDTGAHIQNVFVGKITAIDKHPNADKLVVCQINMGKTGVLQIVTGAKNVTVGDLVPVAVDGALLAGGLRIKSGELRGVLSQGMLCSGEELDIDDDIIAGANVDGILILPSNIKIGSDIKEVLGLNEIILDISLTANRADCQSVYGLSREIAAMLKRPLKPLNLGYKVKKANASTHARGLEVLNDSVCTRYTGTIVQNVHIAPSPDFIKRRLKWMGLKPINNMVDITNYVLLEVGQPLHAFDIRNVVDKIVVRNAKQGEEIKLLDGETYTLKESMVVIADTEKALAVAGIMGGAQSGVVPDTETVLIESARFARGSVRATARALGLKSDSSARFEKGVDYISIDTGRNRALALIEEIGAGEITELSTEKSISCPQENSIETSSTQISNVLGIKVSDKKIKEILTALGIGVESKGKNLMCTIPLFREDIDAYPDLAEEVIRFYGYDKIQSTMFKAGKATPGGYSARDKNIAAIKSLMMANGAFEVLTYSFISDKLDAKLNVAAGNEKIKILNPLSEDYAYMRTTLSGSMLNVIRLNASRKNDDFRLFEIARTYHAKELPMQDLPNENETLCLAFVGKAEDFYALKSAVTELLSVFGEEVTLSYTKCPWLHPGIGADIALKNGKIAGSFGKIHPSVAKNFDIPEHVFIAEVCLETLILCTMSDITYKVLPKYPAVERDLAVIVQEDCLVGDLVEVIKNAAGSYCEHVELFDVYKGAQIQAGCKSVALSVRLRDTQNTLTDKKIQELMGDMINALEVTLNAKLRV